MLNDFLKQRPPGLLVLAVLFCLGVSIGREASQKDVFPVFLPEKQKNIYIELTFQDSVAGVYQFNDDSTICDVIKLTHGAGAGNLSGKPDCNISLISGQRLFVSQKGLEIDVVQKGWMSAGKRIALSVPLHPDRMKQTDWVVLPGIGEKLAERIEQDRQNNGEFGSLGQLTRVKGIGEKRIRSWGKFFSDA